MDYSQVMENEVNMSSNNAQNTGERITALEAEVHFLRESLGIHLKSMSETLAAHTDRDEAITKQVDGKLDELLALRNKGFGAFWAASVIFGTGICGAALAFIEWLRS